VPKLQTQNMVPMTQLTYIFISQIQSPHQLRQNMKHVNKHQKTQKGKTKTQQKIREYQRHHSFVLEHVWYNFPSHENHACLKHMERTIQHEINVIKFVHNMDRDTPRHALQSGKSGAGPN
jgi:hypothetical protein